MASQALTGFLARWEEAYLQGVDLPAADMCPEQPELLERLEAAIEAVRRLHAPLISRNDVPASVVDAGQTTPHVLKGESQPFGSPAGYEILGELGRGGMGIVYKARQAGLNRIVALKMLLPGSLAGAEELERFRREAEALARLSHPNIVQVHEVGEQNGLPFFSLEFCPGGSLDRKLIESTLPDRAACDLVRTLARAVAAAHQAGIVHRDLKPANVLLDGDGVVKVSDFGLAKKLDAVGQTQTGAVMGTPSYMAPEQARGLKDVGPAADTWALGAILYECLTGRPPFLAATLFDTLEQVVSRDPVPPRQLNPQVSLDVEAICLKCLEKEPERRYPTAQALADDLHRVLDGQPTQARPADWLVRLGKWVKRRPGPAALTACLGVVLVVSFLLVNWQRQQAVENLRRVQMSLYASQIAQVQQGLQEGEVPIDLLYSCQPELRGWEWHYLRQACEGGQFTCWGHTNPVKGLAFHPDGTRLISMDDDFVVVWDAFTGQMLRTFRQEQGVNLRGFVLHPNSKEVVLFGHVRVWSIDLETGKAGGTWIEGGEVVQVACHPNGRYLATAVAVPRPPADDPRQPAGELGFEPVKIAVWDTNTGKPIRERVLSGVAFRQGLVWTPDGACLAIASRQKTVFWRLDNGSDQLVLPPSGQGIAIRPDGRVYLWRGGDRMAWPSVVDVYADTGEGVNTNLGTGPTSSVSFNSPNSVNPSNSCIAPDWRSLVTTDRSRVRVYSLSSGEKLAEFQGAIGKGEVLAVSPDGRRVAVGGYEGWIRFHDVTGSGGAHFLTLSGPRRAEFLNEEPTVQANRATSPDGRWMARLVPRNYAKGKTDWEDRLEIFDQQTGALAHNLRLTQGAPSEVGFFSNGEHLFATYSKPGRLIAWNVATGEIAYELEPKSHSDLAICPPRQLFALVNDGKVAIHDARTGKVLRGINYEERATALAFSPDGARLAVIHSSELTKGGVTVFAVSTGTVVSTLNKQKRFAAVTFTPDGNRLVTSGDREVAVWDARTGLELLRLPVPGEFYTSRLSAQGTRLWVDTDNELYLWNSQFVQNVFYPRSGYGDKVGFSEDGRHVSIRLPPPNDMPSFWEIIRGADRFTWRTWETGTWKSVPPRPIPAEKLSDRASLPEHGLLALRGGGVIVDLKVSEEELQRRRRSSAPHLHWHRQQATAAEKEKDWFATLFHLDRLIAARPNEAELLLWRGRVFALQREWKRAAAEFERVTTLDGAPVEADYWLALARLASGDRLRARAAARQVVPNALSDTRDLELLLSLVSVGPAGPVPVSFTLLALQVSFDFRGDFLEEGDILPPASAPSGRVPLHEVVEAAGVTAALGRPMLGIGVGQVATVPPHLLALVEPSSVELVEEIDPTRPPARSLWTRSPPVRSNRESDSVGVVVTLLPELTAEFPVLLLTQRAHPIFQGAALIRLGRHADAVRTLNPWFTDPLAQRLLALAEAERGNPDEARNWLFLACQPRPTPPPNREKKETAWHHQLLLDVVQREVEAKLGLPSEPQKMERIPNDR